ncbi:MAG: ribosomal L7Ae/L30e/S12e/Gadd45 family protein [Clostridia bacterium]|nr:ribosomal L7Ae/L30e/S12e/Gadd45 family protein [Clostridia bacterium]
MTETVNVKRLLSNLGICRKAGKLLIGVPLVCEGMRGCKEGKASLVLYASDCSENTLKKLRTKSEFYGVEARMLPIGCGELGQAVGKLSAIGAVAITDKSLCEMIQKTFKDSVMAESNHNDQTKGTLVGESIEVRRE